MMKFTAGFLICDNTVLFVKKNRPDWQKGLLNVIGGKIEEGESASQGMAREFQEEVGISIEPEQWDLFAIETGPNYECYFFRFTVDRFPALPHRNDVGEKLHIAYAHDITEPMVGNLRWLLPMAMDWRSISAQIYTEDSIGDKPSW